MIDGNRIVQADYSRKASMKFYTNRICNWCRLFLRCRGIAGCAAAFSFVVFVCAASAWAAGGLVTELSCSKDKAAGLRANIKICNKTSGTIELPVEISRRMDEVNYDISISRQDKLPVKMTDYGLSLQGKGSGKLVIGFSQRLHKLEPNNTVAESISLSKLYDLSKPGLYFLQVRRKSPANTAASNKCQFVVD